MRHKTKIGSSKVDVHGKTLQLAAALHQQGDLEEAKKLYGQILKANRKHFDALHLSGLVAYQTGNLEEAEGLFIKALSINPSFVPLIKNWGTLLHALKRYDEAITNFEKAIFISPDDVDVYFNCGNTLHEKGQLFDAIKSFDRVISIAPNHYHALNNRGNIYRDLKKFNMSINDYLRAIDIKSDFALTYNNLGNVLHHVKKFDDAVLCYNKALSIKPDYEEVYFNLGNTLFELNKHEEALINYKKVPGANPLLKYVEGLALHTQMKISDWRNYQQIIGKISTDIIAGKNTIPAFAALATFDCPYLQYLVALLIRQETDVSFHTPSCLMNPKQREKIRIGYFSADFREHPMSQLMVGIFEGHNRNSFEIIAFSFGHHKPDKMTEKLKDSFDKFFDVKDHSDEEIVDLAHLLGIDIAVDLMGYTTNSRSTIFFHRCAPVQVNYLGYPGTISSPAIDYIVGDHVVIPPQKQKFFHEKVLYMPNTYYPASYNTEIFTSVTRQKEFSREDLFLPQQGFVFCCFNNSYKIVPTVFDIWMNILRAVEGSVLWLLEDNESGVINLRKEARDRGVSPDRIIFAKKISLGDHLARQKSADLFLDTLPYNAHTTATDALWAGLPVLTRTGESFAACVAASLLNAVGLPELVTTSADEYERLAIRLATHPEEMRVLKQKLAHMRLSSKLFDTPLYLRHLEAAYTAMYERYHAGLKPEHIYINDETTVAE